MSKKPKPITLKEPPRRPGDPVPPPEPIAEIEAEPARPAVPYETDTYDENLARLDRSIHDMRSRGRYRRPQFTIFTVLGAMWETRFGRIFLTIVGGIILLNALF